MPRNWDAFDHAQHTAHEWLADVARAFDTDDRQFAYRVLRAWLHALRDRLTVEGAATFAAQLPELLRGVYYDGWQPHRAPVKYGPDEYVRRVALEARIPAAEVRRAGATVAGALARWLSPGQLDETLAQLPASLRALIAGGVESGPANARAAGAAEQPQELLADLEARVDVLTEAVRTLATGFEAEPGAGVDEQRRSRAARLAAEILLDIEKPTASSTHR